MKFWYDIFCKFLFLKANLVDQNQLGVFLLDNIFKIRKNMTEIAKNSMNFGDCLNHEFAIFGKFFCIDLLGKCIALRYILVNNLSFALVRTPLIFTHTHYSMYFSEICEITFHIIPTCL